MRRAASLSLLVLLVLAATGIAVANSGSGEVSAVSGDISAELVGTPEVHACGDPHDNTFLIRASFEGTVSSPDERLAGDLEATSTLVGDNDTGDGVVRARFTVRDHVSGHLKLVGKLTGATTGLTDFRVQGLIDARVIPAGELVANLTLTQHSDFSVTGQFGKDEPIAPSNKAVISTAC